jgi:ribosome-binding protein aMBF1 (putative translation factor)
VTFVEIPRCECCGRIAQYRCAIDQNYVCCECARYALLSKEHISVREKAPIEINVLEKMQQDPNDRTIFEALEDLTGCPPPVEIDFRLR